MANPLDLPLARPLTEAERKALAEAMARVKVVRTPHRPHPTKQ